MKLIVGLGNPGDKYERTRHNAGFLAIDYILNTVDRFMTARKSHEFKSELYTWQGAGQKFLFLKPQTYMNDSGQALKVVCNFYKMNLAQDLLVIHDEVDFPLGTVKLTESSSDAGHNGIKSIIENLGTQDFHRVRIGVETRPSRADMPTDSFVLQEFTDEEITKLKTEVLPQVRQEVEKFLIN